MATTSQESADGAQQQPERRPRFGRTCRAHNRVGRHRITSVRGDGEPTSGHVDRTRRDDVLRTARRSGVVVAALAALLAGPELASAYLGSTGL